MGEVYYRAEIRREKPVCAKNDVVRVVLIPYGVEETDEHGVSIRTDNDGLLCFIGHDDEKKFAYPTEKEALTALLQETYDDAEHMAKHLETMYFAMQIIKGNLISGVEVDKEEVERMSRDLYGRMFQATLSPMFDPNASRPYAVLSKEFLLQLLGPDIYAEAEEHIDSTSGQLEGHVENTLREKIRGGMCETKPKNIPCYLDFFGQMLSTGDTVLCVVQGVMTVAKVVELSSHFVVLSIGQEG